MSKEREVHDELWRRIWDQMARFNSFVDDLNETSNSEAIKITADQKDGLEEKLKNSVEIQETFIHAPKRQYINANIPRNNFALNIPVLPPHIMVSSSSDSQSGHSPSSLALQSKKRRRSVSFSHGNNIEDIIDIRTSRTRQGLHRRYLAKWVGRTLAECTWLDADDLKLLRPDLFHQLQQIFSSGDEKFQPEEN